MSDQTKWNVFAVTMLVLLLVSTAYHFVTTKGVLPMPEYDRDREKKYTSSDVTSEFGRSSIEIECPFCKTTVRAFLWSLAGSGKKCSGCGGIHHRRGTTAPLATVTKE